MIETPAVTSVPCDGIEALYRAHRDRLWRAVLAYTGDADVAGDAVAEAFVQALRRGEEIREPLRWVWRAAFRIAAGELKARRRRFDLTATPLDREQPAADLREALGLLRDGQRAALILHYYGGYSIKETAEVLGSTTAAVQMRLVRGRRRLRELLEDDDD